MDMNISDLSGHTFTIELKRNIENMKCDIANYYEDKFENDFLLENNYHDITPYIREYGASDYCKISKAYTFDQIQLIYKGEILKQFHIDTGIYSEDDFKEDNNIIMVIVEKDKMNYYD